MAHLRERLRRREGVLVMGVLNCTPDSFSDGGLHTSEQAALEHARAMVRDGADVIDVGAESTRPRAPRVDGNEQKRRLGSIVARLADDGVVVSIDTTLPEVADFALGQGASLVNSVELEPAGELARVARGHGAMLALMHSRGSMTQMADFSATSEDAYDDVVTDVVREWASARDRAVDAGLATDDVLLDPGLGFHKSARHSLELCARLEELAAMGAHVLVGPSRKSFLARGSTAEGEELPPPDRRLGATIAACLACAHRGAAIVRVHDVFEVRQALVLDRRLARA